ncbi:MAG TPA: O-antigen ligase family protein [Nitrospira sp.]|nr:O-antigen ligase family protein [Nitrospira sp.]
MSIPVSRPHLMLGTRPLVGDTVLRSRAHQWVWRLQSAGLLAFTFMSFFPAWSHVQEYLFLSLVVMGCAVAYGQQRPLLTPSALNLPIALWLGWILLSVPFALDPAYSFGEWRKVVVKVLWFYWALLVLRNTEYKDMEGKVLTAVALGSLGLCCYALFDFVSRGGILSDRPVRARAPLSDYNWLSSYMVMAVPLLAAGMVRMPRLPWIVLYAGTAVLALTAQALSFTRAGWLALLSQGLACGLYFKRVALMLGIFAGALITVTLLLVIDVGPFHQDTRDLWTVRARAAVWSLMLQEIGEHPLVGIGYGTETFMARFGDRPETIKTKGSHNFFLMTAMGSGIPALAFLLWIFATGIRECLRAAHAHVNDPDTAALWVGLALMLVGVAVRNLFDAMFMGSLACLFWILLATGLSRIPPRQVSS